MKFDIMTFITNPFVLIFFTICFGNLFGKIKFGKCSFGITGSLFVGLLVGFLLTKFVVRIDSSSPYFYRAHQIISGDIVPKNIGDFSLLIFIIGTGLLASKTIAYALKNFGKQFIALAIVIPFIGAITSYGTARIVGNFGNSISHYEATGTYTGSLTSSVGLAAALDASEATARNLSENFSSQNDKLKIKILHLINEANERRANLLGNEVPETLTLENTKTLDSEQIKIYVSEAQAGVGIGYSIGYPFGVLAVILGINLIPVFFKIDVEEEKKKYFADKEKNIKKENGNKSKPEIKEVAMDFAAFSLVALLGFALGTINFNLGPIGSMKLGNVGGGILVALFLGYIGKLGPFNFRMNSDILGNMRNYFLSMFLAGTGLNFGFKTTSAIMGDGLSIAIISIVVGVAAVIVGFLVGHYFFHVNWTLLSGAITGGMTSAPGLGAAIEALGCDEPAASYGATQPIATIMMIVFSLMLYQLPL